MRTHCTQGHALAGRPRCQTCDNLTRQRRQAAKYGDGLTPTERSQRGRYKFVDGRRTARPEGRGSYGE
jgi:hypothetical protein